MTIFEDSFEVYYVHVKNWSFQNLIRIFWILELCFAPCGAASQKNAILVQKCQLKQTHLSTGHPDTPLNEPYLHLSCIYITIHNDNLPNDFLKIEFFFPLFPYYYPSSVSLAYKQTTRFQTFKISSYHTCYGATYALSFYKSQNVLCQSKFFEPAQKFDCIQCLFKNFCVGTKTNFTECKSSFCLAQNSCNWHKL